ncbi:hypothetical protein JCM11957_15960 [Caminibacter profundus]
MPDIYNRFLKVTIASLLIASIALIFLFINFYNILIQNQKYTAEIIYKGALVSKIMQMKQESNFHKLIDNIKETTNINIELFSFIHNTDDFFKYLKKIDNKEDFWELKDDKFILYKPIKLQQSCIKCHTSSFKSSIAGKSVNETLGIMKIELPIKEVKERYFKSVFIVLFVLLIALILTLYGYLKNIKYVRENIKTLIKFFEENISKGKYNILDSKMYFKEFESLKNKINFAVNKIRFYRQKMLDRFYNNQLTDLPNRFKLEEDIKKIKKPLVIININDFKIINDTFGFEIGNLLVYEIAKELVKYKKNIYHLFVDEFAFFLESSDIEENKIYIKNFLNMIKKTYSINNHEITVSFRCGISCIENYILTADMAVDFAKQKRKEFIFYEDIKEEVINIKQNANMLTKIAEAIKKDLFVVFYQPIIDNQTDDIYKYEALIRMKDEKGNIYSPDKFLDIAKKANIYPKITKIVIDKVLEKITQKPFSVSINLDALDFENEEIRKYILEKLDNPYFKKYISFELLETEDLTKNKKVKDFILLLKEKGIKILIDDFGSGFSNFSYIFKFNIDGIKIDGSLIKNILNDKVTQDLVISIAEFAKKRNIIIIAEYVSNKEIYEFVKKIGIRYSQGYYFSPPKEDI